MANAEVRKLGIPTIADRVVQAALKLVLEPVFEADFQPVSYGFRSERRAHDAIAEIHMFGSRGYQWVLDADIDACFDRIDHVALMDRVRVRVKDKRVLALVKAFLKAGVLTETGSAEDSDTGTPRCGILSPLLANIALHVLDEHVLAPWRPDGPVGTTYRRHRRRRDGMPTWRIVRYADDFVVLVHGQRADAEDLREHIAEVLARLGLRLSPTKTRVVHLSNGVDFLGFRIQWRRKRGTNRWYVYTFIADRPLKAVKAKIRALTHRVSQADPRTILARINQILRGWVNYFRHAVCSHTLDHLRHFVNWRVIRWLRKPHRFRTPVPSSAVRIGYATAAHVGGDSGAVAADAAVAPPAIRAVGEEDLPALRAVTSAQLLQVGAEQEVDDGPAKEVRRSFLASAANRHFPCWSRQESEGRRH